MSDGPLFKLSCLVESRYQDEYAANLELWRDIERKAQGVIAVVGILLTALFAIAKTESFKIGLGLAFTLSLVISLLAVSVLCAFFALWTRKVNTPPEAKSLQKSASDVRQKINEETVDHRLSGLINDQFDDWNSAVEDIKGANRKKAYDLLLSYIFILIALTLFFGATIFVVTTQVIRG